MEIFDFRNVYVQENLLNALRLLLLLLLFLASARWCFTGLSCWALLSAASASSNGYFTWTGWRAGWWAGWFRFAHHHCFHHHWLSNSICFSFSFSIRIWIWIWICLGVCPRIWVCICDCLEEYLLSFQIHLRWLIRKLQVVFVTF